MWAFEGDSTLGAQRASVGRGRFARCVGEMSRSAKEGRSSRFCFESLSVSEKGTQPKGCIPLFGGDGGIRTHEPREGLPDFEPLGKRHGISQNITVHHGKNRRET